MGSTNEVTSSEGSAQALLSSETPRASYSLMRPPRAPDSYETPREDKLTSSPLVDRSRWYKAFLKWNGSTVPPEHLSSEGQRKTIRKVKEVS